MRNWFSNLNENLKTETLQEEKYVSLDSDKIDILLKKYNCVDQEELLVSLTEKDYDLDNFTEDELVFFNDPEWELLKIFANLGWTLRRESIYGKSSAIKDLISNNYNTQLFEHGNPFKEVINFTLNYFEKYFAEYPIEADNFLKSSFPQMYPYISRQVFKQQHIIDAKVEIDEQNEYNNFLIFCKNHLLKLHPDENSRNEEIRRKFKVSYNSLISYIKEHQMQ